MFKVTPNPPDTDPNTSELDKAAKRALDFYLKPQTSESKADLGQLFTVVNGVDTECLLANLSETLASANAMVSDLAFELDGSRRHVALGIQQLIELGGLLANRALDNVEPR
ncbi:hypothetical protein E3Z27_18190 [Pseudomonas mediterranea]|uniref:DUF3077 domain-containing protein n=1 Tax=Pseudomonas mediterranea TaxID=183795 RepID=A0AAX2DBD4_9PSED|nr:DUF6124 family protein [Pseudomonas mediterranea]KGU85926.1 hypothetical protein N005_07700 [Pseudomonas mediterranea CFBP 5447]MBL0843078.1 hypothetical protein [Pseudomonas mediterranea]QHA83480.1 hypothetical protein E3Z27_18190 [Pseudomonas mediterranea]UZD99311.1 DUF6124 family protein [Pseudomonas mediterranea]SDU49520.1 hypothetical protein SAMN05216476_2564 [Pseudomonas mediterranea]